MTNHAIERVRHELRRRQVTVARIEDLNPRMRRIHFTSDDLAGFPSVGFDDHIKMFIPGTGGPAAAPGGGGSGGFGGGERPQMRDFTPRRFDVAAGTIVLDYALHDAGPASDWAKAATVGATLEIGGPRGSMVVADDFDWYWLIGDTTALPAIGRRLEELRAGVPVTTVMLVDDAAEAQAIETAADWSPHWVERRGGDDAATLTGALAGLDLPTGDGFIWIAAEAAVARAARAAVEAKGHPRHWLKASGYWQRGDEGVHVKLDD